MHCHCDTNNRSLRWTFTDPCKLEVRPDAWEELASPAWLAAPAMNALDTTKSIYGGLTLNMDRQYIGSATATAQEGKCIKHLRRIPLGVTVLVVPHGKGIKCDKNVKYKELMYCHCGTNNRASQWTFTDPCKPKMGQCAREESLSPVSLAAPTMNTRGTTKSIYIRLTLDVDRHYMESVTAKRLQKERHNNT